MSDHKILRSVATLEEEIAALEKAATPAEEEQEDEVEDIVEEVVIEATPSAENSPEEESFKKRYADLRRHSQKQADELKELSAKMAVLEKQKATAGLPSAEEAEAWAKENPKAAAIIRALATNSVPDNGDLAEIKEKLHRSEQEAMIRKYHPDFETIVDTDEFHNWADSQPQSVQKLIFSPAADDVIWAIKQYKAEVLTKPADPKKEAAKAVSTKTKSAELKTDSKGRFTESMVRQMSLSEYEKNEAEIAKAQRDGTFVYDLSGAAR